MAIQVGTTVAYDLIELSQMMHLSERTLRRYMLESTDVVYGGRALKGT